MDSGRRRTAKRLNFLFRVTLAYLKGKEETHTMLKKAALTRFEARALQLRYILHFFLIGFISMHAISPNLHRHQTHAGKEERVHVHVRTWLGG